MFTALDMLKLPISKLVGPKSTTPCCVCEKPITGEHPDVMREIDGKPVHETCYFEEFGKLLEEHPPGHGRGR